MIEITFKDLEELGYESVTDFCRYLISTGGKFENTKIHVYRGDMLCLVVNDINEAAKLQPNGYRAGFRKYRPKTSG